MNVSPYPATCEARAELPTYGKTPALPAVREKTATTIIARATTKGMAFAGTARSSNAPRMEPISVRPMRAGSRFRGMIWPFRKATVPPRLREIKVSMLVATATCGSMPSCIITGMVMSDVPPVTTLIKAVKKKTPMR
jgi:hypothetical protein